MASVCCLVVVLGVVVLAVAADPEGRPVSLHEPHLLWAAGMEDTSLDAWTAPSRVQTGGFGGGEFDSGGGFAQVTTERHHSGSAAVKLVLPKGRGGTRLFRWRELRRHRSVTVSVWLYFPRSYRVVGRFFDIFQFKSRTTDNRVDPIWYLDVVNRGRRAMALNLIWWPRALEGPRRGQAGFRRYRQTAVKVPVRRWFRLTATLRQSSGFDGQLRVWQGRRLLFSKSGIRTSYRNCRFNPWCVSDEWSVNNYSDGLRPTPAVIYADDARIAG